MSESARRTCGKHSNAETATRHATEETIRRLAIAAELRDEETGWHIERMSRYTSMLAGKIGMDATRCELLRLASSMHDVRFGANGC